ncbi:hypothetical protein [Calothrix sp. PCC 6303]|uniref:hypothetical protein n=1 Tax=Calothrix sp. PCC 6303 TaxID=1170562 RepID=UPI0002A0217B|nr:hypothetical protein [Calothrix sp. PCC 6303]AFZ03454.1 hypothetical protein Cal6303_4554 [Calothrix sp. PCC 6303]
MLLQVKETGHLVKISEVVQLIDPTVEEIHGREQAGEEEQDVAAYHKKNLVFPSGETLPRCWVDANYRDTEVN